MEGSRTGLNCLGLVDTPDAIHFGRDPSGPLPPLDGRSARFVDKKDEKSVGSLLSQEQKNEPSGRIEWAALRYPFTFTRTRRVNHNLG